MRLFRKKYTKEEKEALAKKLVEESKYANEIMPCSVSGSGERTDVTYTTKHGLVIRKSKDIGDTAFRCICRLAEDDPNFAKNAKMGIYMPRCNGMRTVYRGKDAVGKFFHDAFWFIIGMGMVALVLWLLLTMFLGIFEAGIEPPQ